MQDAESLPSGHIRSQHKIRKPELHCSERSPLLKPAYRSPWNLLLILPALALIFPGVYARETPELFGIPFFYWYQFGWIILTSFITAFVYRVTNH